MIDPNTLGAAYALAFGVGGLFGLGMLAVAGIIHLVETRKPRRRKTRRHNWSS